MRMFRSFAFVVLPLAALTACSKVHPASPLKEDEPRVAEPQPIVVAANKPAEPAVVDKNDNSDVNNINLEVVALEAMDQLKLTRPQLEHLAKLAATLNGKPAARRIQVSAEYLKALQDLRTALIEDNGVRIADRTETLEELRDKENPEFEEVEISAAARRHTAELLHALSARQVMGFLADFAEEFPDPRDKIEEAFDEIRQAKKWEELRDEVAGQVGWLVGGLDTAVESKVRQHVAELLNRVHKMNDEEYKNQQAELERQIESIVGKVGPTEVIRHFIERSLAELLSNPRLSEAVAARLQKEE